MDSPVSPLAPEKFAAASNVSRETMARLAAYLELLAKWRETVNLVSRASMADPWRRHMLDSAQLLPLLRNPAAPLLDMAAALDSLDWCWRSWARARSIWWKAKSVNANSCARPRG